MNSHYHIIEFEKNIELCLVQNPFDSTEYQEIWEETVFLLNNAPLKKSGKKTGTATDSNGKFKAINKYGIFLDAYYGEKRKKSAYLKYYKKVLNNLQEKKIVSKSKSWNYLFNTHKDQTLFTKYEKNSWYDFHSDSSVMTQLFWIGKNPKKFTGGDLHFKTYDYRIEYRPNTMIIFPGWLEHKVSEVIPINKYTMEDLRFSYSTFYCN